MRETTRKVILRLKEVRDQKRLTYQEIVDACEAQNEAVSLSTVRRIFSKGSEDGPDYRQYTINAIFRAVVGTDDAESTTAEEAYAENAALKAVVDMKDAMIADLQQQIETLTQEKSDLQHTISVMKIKLDTTTDMFRLAMESIGKSAMQ